MITVETVLVLGAGASMAYGLPSGKTLKRQILAFTADQLRELPSTEHIRYLGTEQRFLEAFRRSHFASIDSFLASRPEFMSLGKTAIAAALLPCESPDMLLDREPDDHWYGYLADALHAPWDQFEQNKLSVITFNYDRSLEVFLETTLSHRHGKSLEEARALVARAIPIVHVYGRLGSTDPAAPDYVPYGASAHPHVLTAAGSLNVIPEARDESPEFRRAQELISRAQTLAFLGFGFDETNVRRLGGHSIQACAKVDRAAGGVQGRRFAATALGLTEAQRRRAAESINDPQMHVSSPHVHLHDMQCEQMLRHTLVF